MAARWTVPGATRARAARSWRRSRGGGEAVANGADVSDFDPAEALVRQAIDTYGQLDVLVNVAGILRDRMIFNMSSQEWDEVYPGPPEGNVQHDQVRLGLLAGAARRRHYRIINFTSGSGLHGAPGQPNYAAAKMGIVGLTYSCGQRARPVRRDRQRDPPGAATRMTRPIPSSASGPGPPARTSGRPDNVAPMVAYLATERSDWITGRVIHSMGYEVSLYSNPEPWCASSAPVRGTTTELAAQVERSFGPRLGRQP